MKIDRLIQRFARRFLFRAMSKGMDRYGGQTPEDRERLKKGKSMARQMRQTQRILRRMGKF